MTALKLESEKEKARIIEAARSLLDEIEKSVGATGRYQTFFNDVEIWSKAGILDRIIESISPRDSKEAEQPAKEKA